MRVVFDTNTVISALIFTGGRLSWLRETWQQPGVVPLCSRATMDELIKVLAYPKFQLSEEEIEILLGDFLPHVEAVRVVRRKNNPVCEDPDDQIFVDLAISGHADALVTGDKALLKMELPCPVFNPAEFREAVGK